ncbi:hypothetical protein WKH56_20860 [Priestia sp. SB1]|uniref:hypothetical protein n=1 Tax=Priestia sp. SB1 TaxID=3132359 RepID=UPI00316DF4F3
MPDIKTFDDLKKALNKITNNTQKKFIAPMARQKLKDHILEDAYAAYTPEVYERTGELLEDKNIETVLVGDGTLSVRSTRHDGERDVVEVIETGKGYSYAGLDEKIGARPFTERTAQDLADGDFEKALKDGLKAQGLDVK